MQGLPIIKLRLLGRDCRTGREDDVSADAGSAFSGSNGLSRPTSLAVRGMNCATPWAPAGLLELNPALLPDQPSKERDRNIAGPLENVAVRRSAGDYELRHYEEGYGWPVFCLASREER
jgi:hypothetical protein